MPGVARILSSLTNPDEPAQLQLQPDRYTLPADSTHHTGGMSAQDDSYKLLAVDKNSKLWCVHTDLRPHHLTCLNATVQKSSVAPQLENIYMVVFRQVPEKLYRIL